jgi:hypothetical protein
MKLSRAFITAVVVVAACSSSSGPKDAVSLTEVNGAWVLPFTRSASCVAAGSVSGGKVYIQMAFQPGGASSSDHRWGYTSTTVDRIATGSVSLATGHMELTLVSGSAASLLSGNVTAAGTFTGTIFDPAPGHQPALSLGSCEFTVTGSKNELP